MLGIKNIASYVPILYEDNFKKREMFEINNLFITEKLGVHKVSRKLKDEETSDMCVKAFQALLLKETITAKDIDCIVVCTQNPDGNGIPHVSAVIHDKIDANENCACFDVSLGCSGYVYTLSIMKSFMESNQLKKGLLFTCDPYSKIIDETDKNTSLLFGDAATVTLFTDGENEKIWFPEKFVFGTQGKKHLALHNFQGYLEMNGRAIFNFAVLSVPKQIQSLLDEMKMKNDQIDIFLFHQATKYVLDMLCKKLDIPCEKIPIRLKEQGNTVSSSIPFLFEKYLNAENINTILMSGFGVGLSIATCLLQKR